MSGKIWRILIIAIVLLLVAIIATTNYLVNTATEKQLFSDVTAIPKNKVGLLLGTAKYQDKARHIVNPYYQNRIDAAVALYMAGKIDFIIVSGDNSSAFYNEPALMKEDLIAKGVPEKRIYMDNAGFRTLDSILRCRDIFGEDHITIISQSFHNQRALYIANHKNVTAVAFNAANGDSIWDEISREKLARVKMVLDLIFNTQAKYYGERIEIK
jgi:SanA protein